MSISIKIAKTEADILKCFRVLAELRPHLEKDAFVETIRRLIKNQNYSLAFLEDDEEIFAIAGFRIGEWLHKGKYLEIEDFITTRNRRSQGYGALFFNWLHETARKEGCDQIRLLSGVNRKDAHRFYMKQGMNFEAHYFSMDVQIIEKG